MPGVTTFDSYSELGCDRSDSVLRLEYVAARVVSIGVSDGQFGGCRRDVDGQLGAGRQRLTIAGPAGCRRRNTSDGCFDDKLLTASEALWRLQLIAVSDRWHGCHRHKFVKHFITFTMRYRA